MINLGRMVGCLLCVASALAVVTLVIIYIAIVAEHP